MLPPKTLPYTLIKMLSAISHGNLILFYVKQVNLINDEVVLKSISPVVVCTMVCFFPIEIIT